jgi:shikimate kinase
MKDQTIYLLIGQKGSGKSFIGKIFEEQFNIKFVRVENWVKEIKREREINDESYLKDAFQLIEDKVRNEIMKHRNIVFESTGITQYFDRMRKHLKKDFEVIDIYIRADKELCLNRIKKRDQSIHINVSDKEVNKINDQVRKKNMNALFEIENNEKPLDQLVSDLEKIIKAPHADKY